MLETRLRVGALCSHQDFFFFSVQYCSLDCTVLLSTVPGYSILYVPGGSAVIVIKVY